MALARPILTGLVFERLGWEGALWREAWDVGNLV
jgi:hypothetical protein